MASTMNDELNSHLVGILELSVDSIVLYAAQRIQELEFLNYTGSQEFDNVYAQNDANLQAAQSMQAAYDGLLDKKDILQKRYDDLINHKDYAEGELASHERLLRTKSERLAEMSDVLALAEEAHADTKMVVEFTKQELKKYQNAYANQVEENKRQSKVITLYSQDLGRSLDRFSSLFSSIKAMGMTGQFPV